MGNAVTYFEIGSADHDTLVDFYRELFGWSVEAPPGVGYAMVDTQGGGGINGGIGRSQSGEPWATFYVEADDLRGTLDRAEALGGSTVMPVTEIPGTITFAMFTDPDGLLIGLATSPPAAGGAPQGPSPGDGAPVDWFEVLGADAARTQAFYGELFGWTVKQSEGGYALVDTGAGRGIQGGVGGGPEGGWATIYASVADVEATLARAEQLGAARVYGPMKVDDHMQTGAFRDPAGNVVGVYHGGH